MQNIDKAIALAQKYQKIIEDNAVITAKQLSQLTYKLRQAGEDIPYLAVATTNINYIPQPTTKQKNYKWLKDQDFGEDFIGFYVHVLPNGLQIDVYQYGEKDEKTGKRVKNTLYKKEFCSK